MGEKTSLGLKIVLASLFTMLLVVFLFTDTFNFGQDDNGDIDVSDEALVGTAEGHNGPLTLAVTMDGDTITDIVVVEHEETDGLADPAFEDVIAAIIDSNSTDVDTVSGATVTSDAIIAAVNNALAGGSSNGSNTGTAESEVYTIELEGAQGPMVVDVTIDGDTITAVEVVEHVETDGLADPALEDVPAAIVAANSTDVEVVSGATLTSEAIIEAVNQALAQAGIGEETAEPEVVVDGNLYTVTVEGHNGPLTVEVTIEEGTITAVEVTEHEETDGLADPAIEDIPAAIVEANSTDVDVISSVTVTSEAIIEAVNLALEAAE